MILLADALTLLIFGFFAWGVFQVAVRLDKGHIADIEHWKKRGAHGDRPKQRFGCLIFSVGLVLLYGGWVVIAEGADDLLSTKKPMFEHQFNDEL